MKSLAAIVKLYGIPNCDQVRKARAWLDTRGVDYRFHDFKREGLAPELAMRWLRQLGADRLINRKGTTWKKLTEAERLAAGSVTAAAQVLGAHPSVVKRPVIEFGEEVMVGFDGAAYGALF